MYESPDMQWGHTYLYITLERINNGEGSFTLKKDPNVKLLEKTIFKFFIFQFVLSFYQITVIIFLELDSIMKVLRRK